VDFASEYEVLLKQAVEANPETAIGFQELKASVRKELEAEGADAGSSEMLDFDGFESFFDWFDTVSAYDQMDAEFKANIFKPQLDVIYRALVAEYKAEVQAKACLPETPEATRHIVDLLVAMHPDRLWGTTELGDYNQFADADAPAIIIVFFSLDFGSDRFEVADPYSNAFGSKAEPSSWGLSDAAAQLLQGHNKVHCSRDPSR
jgi:hypothetical protein